jgi:hypothetical protein
VICGAGGRLVGFWANVVFTAAVSVPNGMGTPGTVPAVGGIAGR